MQGYTSVWYSLRVFVSCNYERMSSVQDTEVSLHGEFWMGPRESSWLSSNGTNTHLSTMQCLLKQCNVFSRQLSRQMNEIQHLSVSLSHRSISQDIHTNPSPQWIQNNRLKQYERQDNIRWCSCRGIHCNGIYVLHLRNGNKVDATSTLVHYIALSFNLDQLAKAYFNFPYRTTAVEKRGLWRHNMEAI